MSKTNNLFRPTEYFRPSGVEEAVKALVDGGRLVMAKRTAPALDGGAGSGDPPSGGTPLTLEEQQAAKKMHLTPEQYAAAKKKAGAKAVAA